MDMEDVILEQMEILDPELYEKYNTNLRKIQDLEEAKRKEKEKANDSKLEEEEVEKREAPGKTQSTGASALRPQVGGKRAETPEIPKMKLKKPSMKEYLEKRANIFREAANERGQTAMITEK
ncbi:hypothetical protein JTB14_015404 [Gonioctena quinquepunctata]|nr:hypothetical protein JTB14_015404 [Gonioctena quinquepunctata]